MFSLKFVQANIFLLVSRYFALIQFFRRHTVSTRNVLPVVVEQQAASCISRPFPQEWGRLRHLREASTPVAVHIDISTIAAAVISTTTPLVISRYGHHL